MDYTQVLTRWIPLTFYTYMDYTQVLTQWIPLTLHYTLLKRSRSKQKYLATLSGNINSTRKNTKHGLVPFLQPRQHIAT